MTDPTRRMPSLYRCFLSVLASSAGFAASATSTLELSGLTVTPHLQMDSMRYRRAPEPANGARVQLFLRHTPVPLGPPLAILADAPMRFNGTTPAELLNARAWTWHDMPSALAGIRIGRQTASSVPSAISMSYRSVCMN